MLKDEYAKLKAEILPGWDETKITATTKPAAAATKPAAAAAPATPAAAEAK
jgi:hypothetical protein